MRTPRGVVAAGHTGTVAAAAEVLRAGGNAFDAAVAAGFAAAVVEPCLTSLAGGGFLLARTAAGDDVVFDFFVDTPGRGQAAGHDPVLRPVTLRFGAADQVFHVGHGSVAVPGCLAGYLHVHARLGRLELADVIGPARRLADAGVALGDYQAAVVRLLEPILTASAEGAARFRPGGHALGPDDIVRNEPLAAFLADIAAGRVDGFASPSLAAAIERDMQRNGGQLTAADLAAYQVVEREPLKARYRGATLLTNPPPSFGGGLVARALDLLEAGGPLPPAGSAARLRRLAEVLEEVTRHHTGVRDDAPDAGRGRGGADDRDTTGPGGPRPRSRRGTTHITVCDREGNLAAMTTSNGSCSGVILADTGVMANNIMGEEDLHPGGFGHHAPGIRVGSMMCPSVLLREGQPPVALGSGGSERIRSAMAQVIVALVDDRLTVPAAVAAPRIHWDGSTVQVEPGFDPAAVAGLAASWPVNEWTTTDLYFGGAHVAAADGSCAGDRRRGGAATVVDGS